ncbi:MAG TPA: hypothetical protein PKA27_08385 [Fimbriimonadaceae bacterium]|nr:hypothetical protein [Fimbriimonadaceae bacterium]
MLVVALLSFCLFEAEVIQVYPGTTPPVLRDSNSSIIVHFEIDASHDFDRSVLSRTSGTETSRRLLPGFDVTPVESSESVRKVILLERPSLRDQMRGRYLGIVLHPPESLTVPFPFGNVVCQPDDAILLYALRITDPEFRVRVGESRVQTFYRALSTFWRTMDYATLENFLDSLMPVIRHPVVTPYPPEAAFNPDARFLHELSQSLDPIRRLIVLWRLQRYGYRETEELLVNAIFALKDNPEIERVRDMQGNVVTASFGGPGDYFVDSKDFQRRAEACSVDEARACFIRSIQRGGGIDKPRLARMLSNSGRKTQYEVCSWLGRLNKDPQWDIREIPYDRRDAELDRFVRHWREVYGV